MRKRLRAVITFVFIGMGIGASAQTDVQSTPPPEADTTRLDPNAPMVDFETPKQYIVNKIRVNGIKYLDPEIIASTSGLQKGDTVMIPSDYISSAIRKMWDQHYYSDVKIVAEPVGDSVNLEIFLQERPRVYQWKYEGVRKGELSDLEEKLDLKRGGDLSDYVLKNSTDLIRKFYTEKGFRNVTVDVRQENDTTIKNAVNVTFVVNRNSRVRIGKIEFEGNKVFSDRKLRKTMKKTHQKSFNVFRSTRLKDKDYAEDKENLIDYYNAQGYRNAELVSDSIYTINDKRIGIHIKLEEGNKFYYRNVSWLGNTVYSTEYLNRILGVTKGAHYDRKSLHKQLGIGKEMDPEGFSVSSEYQNNGYIFSSIEPTEVVVAPDSVDLEIKIYEGKQARINEVNISGNFRVDEKVIRRELYVRPGELYDRSLLMQTLRQLSQMQHFNPEALQPGIMPVTSELVDISFPLEEQASDQFEISGGWGSGMFVGSIGVRLNNFSVRNLFKGDRWTPYPSGQNQQLSIRGQSNGTYYKAISMNFVEPWLGGKKPNSFTLGLYYSDQTNAYNIFQAGTKHFRTIGASVGIGRRLNWPDRFFTIYNEISYQAYNLKDWDSFLVSNGTSNIITLTTVFGRNTVDQPIYPRSGSDFSISLSLTPPYSLFDDIDYSRTDLTDLQRYRWIEFHKWKLNGEWYVPLSRDRKLVMMARAQMGYLGAYDKNKPSPFEGFDVGGDGMSGYDVYGVDVIAMRGYSNGSLTPYSYNNNGVGNYARAYNKYTVELRYPFLLQPTSTIYGLVFAEAGNAFATWKDFDPFRVKRALGVGVRIYLPFVGLLGFDWGYGFDNEVGQTGPHGGQIHFMIGQQF